VKLTSAQLQKIWLLSDTVLYPEAISFMRKLAKDQGYNPLPAAQMNDLLNIAESARYKDLEAFVIHQRGRDWPRSKHNIKTFYTELETYLTQMRVKRVRNEFHLLNNTPGGNSEIVQQVDALMASLSREFIQHLLAENGVLAVEMDERKKQRTGRR
jgi:hypothetical protein